VNSKPSIYVAGHRGMVGSAIVRQLLADGLPPQQLLLRSHQELDLTRQGQVEAFFARERPDQVYLAAAKVGGIHANNSYPAEFIYSNLMVAANVVDAAFKNGVKQLLYLGSSCIYPRLAEQPMTEEALLSGPLEPTNEPYAIAKIGGIKLCESYNRQYGASHGLDYRSLMPTNLYGPGDNYHPENSHVIPALIRRIHEAKQAGAAEVSVWGTGTPLREFLYVDDLARACVLLMQLDRDRLASQISPRLSHINVGSGEEISIQQLAQAVARAVGYTGQIRFDPSKPDGMPRKLMDSSRMRKLGWEPETPLDVGLSAAYADFLQQQAGHN
jgi:GDP-L-fucose synthase